MELGSIQKAIQKIKELPTLPTVATKVNVLLNDPKSNASQLSEVIEYDQSITAKLLKLVNSAFYSLPKKVTNVQQAIALLGYKTISHIVLTLSVFDTLKVENAGVFDRAEFWRHSIATAICSMKIAEVSGYNNEDVFIGALLHDIGKVFLDAFMHEEFMEIINYVTEKKCTFFEAEKAIFEVDHAMIGEWISRYWQFPILPVAMIKHHHQKLNERKGLACSGDVGIDIVRLADAVVRVGKVGKNGDSTEIEPAFTKEMFRRLPLDEKDVLLLLEDVKKEMKKAEMLLSFALQ